MNSKVECIHSTILVSFQLMMKFATVVSLTNRWIFTLIFWKSNKYLIQFLKWPINTEYFQDGVDTYVGKVTLEHLLPGRQYIVHIASKNAHNYNSLSERFLFTTKEERSKKKEEEKDELTKYRKVSSTPSPVLRKSSKKPLRKVKQAVDSDISASSAIRIISYNLVCINLFANVLI